jgi:hypothetical protein
MRPRLQSWRLIILWPVFLESPACDSEETEESEYLGF